MLKVLATPQTPETGKRVQRGDPSRWGSVGGVFAISLISLHSNGVVPMVDVWADVQV
jgi:hypothetical protein